MAATRIIPVRVDKNQYERIKDNANYHGYKSVSEYVRTRILVREISIRSRLRELHESVDKLLIQLDREKFK